MSVERTERKIRKGKAMAVETTVKVTCDGCGKTRSVVMDHTGPGPHPVRQMEPWYKIDVEMSLRRAIGQSLMNFDVPASLDACSPACVRKALSQMNVPEADPASIAEADARRYGTS